MLNHFYLRKFLLFFCVKDHNEKLAVMIFDPTLNHSIDFETVSNEFIKRNIVWVLVALTTPDFNTWDSYHTLARRTGMNK